MFDNTIRPVFGNYIHVSFRVWTAYACARTTSESHSEREREKEPTGKNWILYRVFACYLFVWPMRSLPILFMVVVMWCSYAHHDSGTLILLDSTVFAAATTVTVVARDNFRFNFIVGCAVNNTVIDSPRLFPLHPKYYWNQWDIHFGVDSAVAYEFCVLTNTKKNTHCWISFSFECRSVPFVGVKLFRINQSKAIGRAIHNVFFSFSKLLRSILNHFVFEVAEIHFSRFICCS